MKIENKKEMMDWVRSLPHGEKAKMIKEKRREPPKRKSCRN
jgi:hypothetical protein